MTPVVRVTELSPVDPEVAAALLRSHLREFFENSPRVVGGGWTYGFTDDPLVALVQIPARPQRPSGRDVYTLRLDGTYYDTWPPSAAFVEAHEGGWRRARLGSAAYPLFRGSPGGPPGEGPGFAFALHDDLQFPDQHKDQLICFSFNLGYYTSNHAPSDDQKWRPGVDRLDATLSRIHVALNSLAYLGPSQVEGT